MNRTPDQHIDDLIDRHEASWRLGYDAFPAVLNRLGLQRGAEIGVAFGGHSEAILQNTSVTKLYAIDSYQHRPEYDDPMNLPQPVFDRLFERTGQRLGVFGDRVQQIRLDSVDAATRIDEPLDFVYIDGDHSYQGIRDDLEAWFPLIREGGILAGHDYGQPAFPGVKASADQFFDRFDLPVHHEGKGIWWAQRPATSATVVIAADHRNVCDADLYERLTSAGLRSTDALIVVHDANRPCDATTRVLSEHDQLTVRSVTNPRGPWHAAVATVDDIDTPLVMAMRQNDRLPSQAIETLRKRICTSGAIAAGSLGRRHGNDFALRDLLATRLVPSPLMLMTSAWQRANTSRDAVKAGCSDRLLPWLALLEGLGRGGRLALEPMGKDQPQPVWSSLDCVLAAQTVAMFAELIDGADLLRLKRPSVADDWLNVLDERPLRTRANILPVDVPPTFDRLRLLDRVVHKVRRATRRAA
jgi:hypothetical protein